jgi:hypothetical protein
MKARKISRSLALLALLCPLIAGLFPAISNGSEVAATHLVYEKAVKMKKVDAFLFLPFLDQSRKSDNPQRPRQVDCSVFGEGKSSQLPAKGRFRLRLLGRTGTSSPWQSQELSASLDETGQGSFATDEIQNLVQAAGDAEIELIRIEFDGGKGKKVSSVTVDCIHYEAGS